MRITASLWRWAVRARLSTPAQRFIFFVDQSPVGSLALSFLPAPVCNMSRTTLVAGAFCDQSILEGDRLLLLHLWANRDAEVLANAEESEVSRQPNRHVAFGGYGRHFCLDAQLARRELTVLLDEVLDGLPEVQLLTSGMAQQERVGNSLLGIEMLPVRW